MSSENAHLGYNLTGIAIGFAALGVLAGTFRLPWLLVVFLVVWLTLSAVVAYSITEAKRREFFAGTLRHPNYTQIYTYFCGAGVTWVWDRFCTPVGEKAALRDMFRAALTWKLYDAALLMAVAYPIVLIIGQWMVTGHHGRIGGSTLFLQAPYSWVERTTFWVYSVITIVGVVGFKVARSWPSLEIRRKSHFWLLGSALLGLAVMIVSGLVDEGGAASLYTLLTTTIPGLATGLAVALSLTLGIFTTGAVAVAVVFVFAITYPALSFGGLILGFLVAAALIALDHFGRQRFARISLTCALPLILLIAAWMIDWSFMRGGRGGVTLVLAVLPFFNAVFDVISVAITLSMIKRGLRSRLPSLFGLVDFVIACLLFFGLGATLLVVVHGLNVIAGLPFVDLRLLFDSIEASPADSIWLYLMLFSTIVPTALHGLFSLIGLQGLCPRPTRRWVAGLVEAAAESPFRSVSASVGLGLVWTIPVMCVVALGWIAWHFGKGAVFVALKMYFEFHLWLFDSYIGAI